MGDQELLFCSSLPLIEMVGKASRQGDPVSSIRPRIGKCVGEPQWAALRAWEDRASVSWGCLKNHSQKLPLFLPTLFLPGGESEVAQLTSLSQVLNWPSWLEKHSPGLTALPAISTNARPIWGIQQARPHAQCHEAFCLVQDMVQRYKRADLIAELLRVNIYKCQWCLMCNERNMSGTASPPATRVPEVNFHKGKSIENGLELSWPAAQAYRSQKYLSLLWLKCSCHQSLVLISFWKQSGLLSWLVIIICIFTSYTVYPIYPFLIELSV